MPKLPDMPDIIPDMLLPTLYKDDINQGSVLDRFKINQLKLGMSQAQVQDLIGSPSIIDPFHNKQWNYINHSTLHEKDDVHYRLILIFDNKKLTEINTSGISSLSALTEKEKKLEDKRIAAEKAAVVAKQAAIQAKKIATEKLATEKLATEKLATEKLATEKSQAKALKKKNELAQIKQRKADQQKAIKTAEEKIIIQQPKSTTSNKSPVSSKEEVSTDKPWYQFW